MAAPSEPAVVQLDSQTTAVIAAQISMDALVAFFDTSFGRLAAVLDAQGVAPTGAAFAWYRNPPTDVFDLEVGFPTATPIEQDGDVVPGTLPAGPAATAVHAGSFDDLGQSWGALFEWVAAQGLTPSGPLWEVYLTEPSPDMDPADLRTALYLPLAGHSG